jgi:hypothetical protein
VWLINIWVRLSGRRKAEGTYTKFMMVIPSLEGEIGVGIVQVCIFVWNIVFLRCFVQVGIWIGAEHNEPKQVSEGLAP